MSEYARTCRESAEQWLLRAAPDERIAREEWTYGVAVLVAGRTWDAVRVPYAVLDPSLDGDTDTAVLRDCVTRLGLVGPAFCHPHRPYLYFLVQPGTDSEWPTMEFAAARVECLGANEPYVQHIGVPRIDRTERPERPAPFWLVPPDNAACRYVDAAHLIGVLRERVRHQATFRGVR